MVHDKLNNLLFTIIAFQCRSVNTMLVVGEIQIKVLHLKIN